MAGSAGEPDRRLLLRWGPACPLGPLLHGRCAIANPFTRPGAGLEPVRGRRLNVPRRRREPEPYQRYRQPLQQKWRPLILARDHHRCRNCGAKGAGEDSPSGHAADGVELHMAHITDCAVFVKAAGDHRAVTFSFRWDNLYTLCRDCHMLSHRFRVPHDDLERRLDIQNLERRLRLARGWTSPYAVLPPEMVPPRCRPDRSFHDCLRISPLVPFPTLGTYFADGGPIFRDEEAARWQATLDTADA